jgi:hypothetical protein
MLRCVGKGLGEDVVGADLDVLVESPLNCQVEAYRDGRSPRERLQRGSETSLGEDRRVDAA